MHLYDSVINTSPYFFFILFSQLILHSSFIATSNTLDYKISFLTLFGLFVCPFYVLIIIIILGLELKYLGFPLALKCELDL